jgi:hypothetical protein
LEYEIGGKTFDDRINITVVKVDLDVSKATLTLNPLNQQDYETKLEVKVQPSTVSVQEYEIGIRRVTESLWYTIANVKIVDPWQAKIAGRFKLRGRAKIYGSWFCTPKNREKDLTVQFPTYSQVVGSQGVQGATDAEWTNTLNDCTQNPNQRRERGFWIRLNTTNMAYEFTGAVTGPWVGPTQGAYISLGSRPADNPTNPTPVDSGATYSVASFHTHTPTTYRSVGRPVGPSSADINQDYADDVAGVVYDYIDSPPGSGGIPAGHPENGSAQRYHSGPNRRSTP